LERDRLLSELKQKVRKLKEENATLRRDLELALQEGMRSVEAEKFKT